jgi:aminopeptidase
VYVGGAAAVVASTLAIAQLKLPYASLSSFIWVVLTVEVVRVNLITFVPLTENMPGPSASKPGDMYV